MSLLDEMMSSCVVVNKAIVDDGYGGYKTAWTDGANFDAAIVADDSIESRVGQAAGVTSIYTVTIRKEMMLEYHDVFRRVSDGKIFRVTSDGDDKFTPNSASLDMRQVTAEEWRLTS